MVILKAILAWCSWHSDWYSYNPPPCDNITDMGCVFSMILGKWFIFIMWFIFRPCQQYTIVIWWYRRPCRAYNYTRVWDKKKSRHQTFQAASSYFVRYVHISYHFILFCLQPSRGKEWAYEVERVGFLEPLWHNAASGKSCVSSKKVREQVLQAYGLYQLFWHRAKTKVNRHITFSPKTEKIIGGKKMVQ